MKILIYFFFTPDQIHHIEDNIKFDLAINSSSFSEMEKDSINEYFNFIQKKINSDGFFFNLNRYFKDSVNQKIRFYEFPYDYYWKKKYSDVFIGFRRLHCLITQRVANKNNEIKDVLNEIKNLSNNHEYPSFYSNLVNENYQNFKNLYFLVIRILYDYRRIWR